MGFIFYTIIILLAFLGWFISIYNKIIRLIEEVNNNQKQIDVQLDRRYKVFESLIEVVKKYMDYEKTTLKEVVALRNQAVKASEDGVIEDQRLAEDKISAIAGNIKVVLENYPDLKANENVLQLQEEIVNTENKLAFAKQALNDSIERYYATRKSFIESIVVGAMSDKLDKEFIYWNIDKDKLKSHEDYTVKM